MGSLEKSWLVREQRATFCSLLHPQLLNQIYQARNEYDRNESREIKGKKILRALPQLLEILRDVMKLKRELAVWIPDIRNIQYPSLPYLTV